MGFHEQDSDAPIYLQIAQLCIEAGADTALIPRWIAVLPDVPICRWPGCHAIMPR